MLSLSATFRYWWLSFLFPGPALSRHTGGPVYFGYAWANGVYGCAFIAEAIRAGIRRYPPDSQAARSSGLVISEYALHRSSTGDQNRIAGHRQPIDQSGQNSSVLSVIAGLDPDMYYADLINLSTFKGIPVYTFVALFYLLLTIPLSLAVHYMERRFAEAIDVKRKFA